MLIFVGSFQSYNDTLVSRAFVVPDGIPWTTLAYTNGPGYDFGKRVNNSDVDTGTSLCHSTPYSIKICNYIDIMCYHLIKTELYHLMKYIKVPDCCEILNANKYISQDVF